MKYLTLLWCIPALLLSGCTSDETHVTQTAVVEPAPSDTFASDAIPAGELSTAGLPAPEGAPYDAQFLDTMTAHHRMGIHMNQMQIDRGSDSGLKEILRKSNAMMQKDLQEMKSWRDQWHTNIPVAENRQLPGGDSMNMDMQHMQNMSGPELDRMMAEMMITHHQGALAMARDALQRTERPELRQKAQQIIDDQQREIEDLQKWMAGKGQG